MTIKAIVFDLDDTLLDTSNLLIPIAETDSFFERITQPLPLMPGALENLELLSKKYYLCLLTLGNMEVQRQKVKSLDISRFFKRIEFANIEKRESKKSYLEKLIVDENINPLQLLSIGNRRTVEIREAKQLGAWTCLFRYGEHSEESVFIPEDQPDFEVSSHKELIHVCRL